MKSRVLFVCIENSCRSQIAEGFAKALGSDVLESWSAGSRPSGIVNPKAIAMMRERGIDISRNPSKSLEEIPQSGWDFVVTMGCGDACPFVPSKTKTDWGIPDPKNMPEPEFRKVRDLIEHKVRALIEEVKGHAAR